MATVTAEEAALMVVVVVVTVAASVQAPSGTGFTTEVAPEEEAVD